MFLENELLAGHGRHKPGVCQAESVTDMAGWGQSGSPLPLLWPDGIRTETFGFRKLVAAG